MDLPAANSPGSIPSPAERNKAAREGRLSRNSVATWVAIGFLLPNVVGFLVFTIFPVIASLLMAFTSWSLKPSVPLQYLGLRNFTDLLGARPVGDGARAILWLFVLCAVAIPAGAVGTLWACRSNWKGARIGGLVMATGGGACAILGIVGAGPAAIVGGVVAIVWGAAIVLTDADWSAGWGALPSSLLAAAIVGLCLLWRVIGASYTPNDPYFWQYLYNTIYLMIGVPFSIAGSLWLALLLHERLPSGDVRRRGMTAVSTVVIGLIAGAILWHYGQPNLGLICAVFWLVMALGIIGNVVAFRTLFYLPTFTAGVALMILWQQLYNPKTGPIDAALAAIIHLLSLHATPPQWLGDVTWAKPALIIMGVWTGIGGTNMLLYLAGLSNIPKELTEAAEMDGAGKWATFRHVTWPQLAPTTFFISITAIIWGLQGGFEQARVLTQGGPAGATTTLSYYIYNKAFQDLDTGYAAAISWILFAIIFAVTVINWKFGKGLEVD